MNANRARRGRPADPARLAAFRTLRAITADDAYANLALAEHTTGLSPRDAAFATELVAGTCRSLGLYDAIIASASGRGLKTLQPAVVDLLRLGTHQLLELRVPGHAAISATVDLARAAVSDRVTGVVNAILRKVAALDPDGWAARLRTERPDAAALLAGLARDRGERLLAAELQPHRAALVARALAAYPPPRPVVIAADGTRPAWPQASFARVLLDAPCTGLGALRRRPESRWRRQPSDLDALVPLQHALLRTAIASARPDGVIAYVTCSPHHRETVAVVEGAEGVEVIDATAVLPEVPDAARGPYLQLWPHRHGTDAMFLALLRKTATTQ